MKKQEKPMVIMRTKLLKSYEKLLGKPFKPVIRDPDWPEKEVGELIKKEVEKVKAQRDDYLRFKLNH